MSKYRIVENELGYFPQVKKFWGWKRIGVHIDGFGLYDGSDYGNPKSYSECQLIIERYKDWISLDRTPKTIKKL